MTHDSKFEPSRSEGEHVTSRSQRLPTIINLYEWPGKKHFVYLKLECQSGGRTSDLGILQAGSFFNHCTKVPPHNSSKLWQVKHYSCYTHTIWQPLAVRVSTRLVQIRANVVRSASKQHYAKNPIREMKLWEMLGQHLRYWTNTGGWSFQQTRDVYPMLVQCWINDGHRPRHWPNIEPTLGKRLVCVGLHYLGVRWDSDKALPRKHEELTRYWFNVGPAS